MQLSHSEQRELQSRFFHQMGDDQQVRQLLEYLPGIYFFLKDRESRMIAASRLILDRFGLASEEEIVGTTDYDFFPPQLAEGFVRDDQLVINSGEPLLNRVEIWYTENRLLDWFVTNKLPVRNRKGEIIGVMGTVRSYEGSRGSLLPYSQISHVVDYIREHHRDQRRITVQELAKRAGVSTRQLHRRFQQVLGMSAQEFLNKTRIQAACDALLNSSESIARIAVDFGFCDQSAFTQRFKKQIGLTPHQFRERHAPRL